MAQPGTVPVSAPIDTYLAGNVYPTHKASRGLGGFRTVADTTERDNISDERREEGMWVLCLSDGIVYQLDADLLTWNTADFSGVIPSDVMLKSVYDPNDDGIVNNALQLNSQAASFYLDRTNHTGTQAIATVTGLQTALDAKEDEANKGQANGYAPLNGSGKIDPSYLTIASPINPPEEWNVVTNTPTLADGGAFVAGDCFIVTVSGNPTARDLGSGSQNWYDGDLAIYQASNTFARVPRTAVGVTQVTTQSGTQTGAVSLLTTAHFAASTNKNFVTDIASAGIVNTSIAPSATNYFMTKNAVEALIVGNSYFNFDLYDNTHTLGDGTSRVLSSLTNPATGVAYTNVSAGAVWTRVNSAYTINVNTMTIDWIAGQEAFLAMQQQGYSRLMDVGGRGYVPNQSWDLPLHQEAVSAAKRGLQFHIDLGGSKVSNLSVTPFQLFKKMPANQAQAAGSQLDYAYHFKNMYLAGIGSANAADVGIHLGGTTNSSIDKVSFAGFNTAVNWIFCMGGNINDIRVDECINDGIVLGTGVGFWSGAGTSTSQSNNNSITNSRFYNGTSNTLRGAITILGSRNNDITSCGFEGHDGADHVIYFNSQGSTNAYQIGRWTCIDFEEVGASTALMKIVANSGQLSLDTFAFTYATPSVDIPIALGISPFTAGQNPAVTVMLTNCVNGAGAGVKFKQEGVCYWWVRNWGTNDYVTFNVAANFDLTGGGTLPDSSHVRFEGIIT